jgi:ribonuclease BN (tRNA processing enzyme)
MHIDHTADLSAVIMHLYMCERKRPIAITGPGGRDGNNIAPEYASPQPGIIEFVELLFGPSGAWRYMNTFEGFGTVVRETPSDIANQAIHRISLAPELEDLGVSVTSVAVPHGMMPSVAYRVDCGDDSFAYSGDISGSTASFVALAKNASMLIHDLALPERDVPHGNLHAKPSAVGRTAQESGVKTLLVTHFMPAIEGEIDDAINIIRHEYTGKIEVASDLKTYDLVT